MNGSFQAGTWTYVVDLPRKASGKRNQKKVGGFKSKREANAALAATINKLILDSMLSHPRSFLRILSQWMEDVNSRTRSLQHQVTNISWTTM